MPWVKLDDAYYRNPKARSVGPLGRSLHLAGSCWSASALTDGKIPKAEVKMLLADAQVKRPVLDLIVAAGLWHDQGDHYLINDWQDYFKSREQVLSERADARERQAKSRGKSHRDIQRDSQSMSQVPRPEPVPRDLHPPTTDSRLAASSGVVGDAIRIIMKADRAEAGAIKNPAAWERTVTERLTLEHGERIAKLAHEYPTATAVDIAGYVRDGTNGLRYHERRVDA